MNNKEKFFKAAKDKRNMYTGIKITMVSDFLLEMQEKRQWSNILKQQLWLLLPTYNSIPSENIFQKIIRNIKGCPSGIRKMIQDGNMNLWKGRKSNRNSYMGKYMIFSI